MRFIDMLVPFFSGVLILLKPELLMRKEIDENEKKNRTVFFQKMGWALMGISSLYLIGKVLMIMSRR